MVSFREPTPSDNLVLVVDDDPLLCDFVALALTEQGYRTLTAPDGMQAVTMARLERPALALIDMSMPRLAGRDLAQELRSACAAPVPCVIMSGTRIAECATDDLIAGYLPKPFDLEDLLATVKRLAHGHPTSAISHG
jgi:DNA-binding response OmpR family regulator